MLPIKTLSATTQAGHTKGQQALMDANWVAFSKTLLAFVARFLLIYGLLMAPWPGLAEGYAKFYQAGGNFLFGELGAKGIVLFQPFSEAGSPSDTRVFLINRDQLNSAGRAPKRAIRTHSRYFGYMPTVFLIALILATPISWSRRGSALLWGMGLIHLYIVFKIFISLIFYFNVYQALRLFLVPPSWREALRITYELFVVQFNISSIFAVIIWLLVSFRRDAPAKKAKRKKSHSRSALTPQPPLPKLGEGARG